MRDDGTTQNMPKRLRQPYSNAQTTQTRAYTSPLLGTCEGKVTWVHAQGSVATCVCRNPAHDAMLYVCMFHSAQQEGWLCCQSSCHGCPALHRRAGPLAPRDKHSLAEGHFFCLVSVGGAGRAVGGVARHGNILAFLVAVCSSPLAYYLFACGGIPFVPFRSLSPPT